MPVLKIVLYSTLYSSFVLKKKLVAQNKVS